MISQSPVLASFNQWRWHVFIINMWVSISKVNYGKLKPWIEFHKVCLMVRRATSSHGMKWESYHVNEIIECRLNHSDWDDRLLHTWVRSEHAALEFKSLLFMIHPTASCVCLDSYSLNPLSHNTDASWPSVMSRDKQSSCLGERPWANATEELACPRQWGRTHPVQSHSEHGR